MHPNPAFRKETDERNIVFAQARGFGTLAVNADVGPILSHIPFLLADDAKSADLHLVRSNPIVRLGETKAVIAVTGPDAYISPDWYGVDDQVPTWNYVAVHLRGTLVPLASDEMHAMLDRQSAAYEQQLAPKRPWTTAKMSDDAMQRMLRQILPFRLHIDKIDGTWKLGQNKPNDVRERAAEKVATGLGNELNALAGLMANPKEGPPE